MRKNKAKDIKVSENETMNMLSKVTVTAHELRSVEYSLKNEPVLKKATFITSEKEVWGFLSNELASSKKLLEIVGNICRYESGTCKLLQFGMTAKKRAILPHVFYIGTPFLLGEGFILYRYLLFITREYGFKAIERGEQIMETSKLCDFDNLITKTIRKMTRNEKVLASMFTAIFSKSKIIILNVPDIKFKNSELQQLSRICGILKEQKRTVLISTVHAETVRACCTHAGIILNGTMGIVGTVTQIADNFDNETYMVLTFNKERVKRILEEVYTCFNFKEDKYGLILIKNQEEIPSIPEIKALFRAKDVVADIKQISDNDFVNAYSIIKEKYANE